MNTLISIFLVGSALSYGVYVYNRLITLRQRRMEAWSGVDVQLKRRYDLIPNLVEIVKGYAAHERDTLEEIVRIRTDVERSEDVRERGTAELSVTANLKRLFALVESYPDLKADKNFRELQNTLTEVEDDLQYARRYYNGTVRDLNTAVTQFPSNLVANQFRFEPAEFFEIEFVTERKAPDVKL